MVVVIIILLLVTIIGTTVSAIIEEVIDPDPNVEKWVECIVHGTAIATIIFFEMSKLK